MARSGPAALTPEQQADCERLQALVAADNGVGARVAADLGITPGAVSQYVTGHRALNLKTAAAFAHQLGAPLARISPRLTRELDELNRLVSKDFNAVEMAHATVPLISYVQAGCWSEASDPYSVGQGGATVMTRVDVSTNAFALEIKGDSMLPEFREGDHVVIDPAVQPQPGDMVVAKNSDDEAMFKKYRPRGVNQNGENVFELVPLNEDYPTRYSDRESITIIGVMVDHHKPRRRPTQVS